MKSSSWLRRQYSGLGFRMMTVMGLALLPLALLSYVQGVQSSQLAEGRVTSAILGETWVAAAPMTAEVVRAQGKAATLAAVIPTVMSLQSPEDVSGCIEVMNHVVAASIGMVRFASFVPPDGKMTCASTGEPRDFSRSVLFQNMLAADKPMISVSPYDAMLRVPVLLYSHPVRAEGGSLMGVVVLAMPQFNLERHGKDATSAATQPLALVTFDGEGNLLTASSGMSGASALLPRGRTLADLARSSEQSFVDETNSDQRRAFAIVPIQPGTLYLMGSWPSNRLDNTVFEGRLPAILFPALMWAASLLVAALAAESHVLRHIRALRDSITAFASGDRRLRKLDMEEAAIELRVVGRAYERMTEAVLRNEAELENEIHQKEVLLREVHHRVKNNLQLIASILNMQLRSARSKETKEAMRTVQERVMSLATVHRELYQTTGLVDVRADELLTRVARDLISIAAVPGSRIELETVIEDIRLPPDQAVPLALFLTEGMANVLKHGVVGLGTVSTVTLRLERQEGGMVQFLLKNTLRASSGALPDDWTQGSDGFGSQLLNAFAMQLGGKISRGRQGDSYELRLEFTQRKVEPDETRRPQIAPVRAM